MGRDRVSAPNRPEMCETAMTWNPLGRPNPVTIPLECSGGAASVTYQRWGAAERMAMDDLTATLLVDLPDGSQSARIGALRAHHAALTIVGWKGFPPELGDPARPAEPLNLRDVEHLKQLDAVTYGEIAKHADKVEPMLAALGMDDDEGKPGPNPDDDEPDPTMPLTTASSTQPEEWPAPAVLVPASATE